MEVVIIGGGPAGIITGLQLLERGISPLILEKRKKIESTACAEGCDTQSIKKIPFDSSPYISKSVKGAKIFFPQDSCISCYIKGVVLERGEWLKGMAKEFLNRGGKLRTNAHVSFIRKDCIFLSNGEKIDYDVLIGADGPFSIVRKYMKIEQDMMTGVQYKLKCDTTDMDYLNFYFNKNFSPHYSWIFPKKDCLNIGLAGNFKQLDAFLSHFGFKKKDILKKEAGVIPVSGIPDRLVEKNIALIGDAASMTNPLSGGGLSPIIHASHILSKNIGDLSRYEKEIKRHPISNSFSLKAKNMLVEITNEELTTIGKILNGKVLGKMSFFDLFSLLKYPAILPKILLLGKGARLAMKWGW